MVLTDDQLKRIARNKEEANRRKAATLAKLNGTDKSKPELLILQPGTSKVTAVNSKEGNCSTGLFSLNTTERPTLVNKSNLSHRMPAQNLKNLVLNRQQQIQANPPSSVIRTQSAQHSVKLEAIIQPAPLSFLEKKKEIKVSVLYNVDVVEALKSVPSGTFDPNRHFWTFPLKDIKLIEDKLLSLKNLDLKLETVPHHIVQWLEHTNQSLLRKDPTLEGAIDDILLNALFPFQRKGIIFGIQRRGKLLLADEMGLGKSIQALGIARFFKSDWPLLIVCPSSVKYSWLEQIRKFIPSVSNIVLIEKGSDQLPYEKSSRTVVILSYDLMVSKKDHLVEYGFQAIIFDESHLLKDGLAQRTKAATEISRNALRIILLSGTPALSRPSELYSQLRIIDSKLFPNFRDFAIRYCDGKQGRYSFEAKGCTNSTELAIILQDNIMIRRLKKDVLEDLPAKRQEVVFLSDSTVRENLGNLRKAKAAYKQAVDNETKHQCLVEYYYETGIAKANSVSKHVIDNFFYEGAPHRKVLVFAHHQVVLDTLSMNITKKGLRSIRIDGTTSSKLRDEQCQLFQNNEDVTVAVLSLTAAGVGITLTAATVVVFAELHWNPGTLKQAEDRAHRVGQKDSVFIQYLIAKGTADDILWPLIQKKLDVLGSCKLSSDTYRDADSVEKTVINQSQGLGEYYPVIKRSKTDSYNC
uniref:SWI/SNF-related matrix-associated actin-dependent regulator of chromatin subfamily A-like protein 1 n=1 Tax=Syphacia muris TaxID=451379 RepID=A0A0N5AS35_9BILA